MNRHILTSGKGLTLVELLVSLAIFSIISVIIIGYLIGSMNNFKRVNEEIALHDEANYVMSEFVNYIFVATKVDVVEDSNCISLITVTNFDGEVTTLGFKNNKAVIDNIPIHPSKYSFTCGGSEDSKITVAEDTVNIKMFIQDNESKFRKKLDLDSDVSFVNVE